MRWKRNTTGRDAWEDSLGEYPEIDGIECVKHLRDVEFTDRRDEAFTAYAAARA